ncbi:S-adenosylmethionine-dependent methyltransferase [Histoplasma ohiense]|nr:S-adenosylmethionine-dependent methyltransferase [Histoplasma ohiense (nom. inval.)]
MPRLPLALLRHAYTVHPLLPLLLRECRDLPSARNELRWLSEHALAARPGERRGNRHRHCRGGKAGSGPMAQEIDRNGGVDAVRVQSRVQSRLREMVRRRARGVPLQYILGDQPFGELEMLCRRGVLIPRPETESYPTRVANLLLSKLAPTRRKGLAHRVEYKCEHLPTLRIVDLCTGTGCIPLLLHSLLSPVFPKLQICGVDISTRALKLARENLKHNIALGMLSERAREEVSFIKGDVLSGLSGLSGLYTSSVTPASKTAAAAAEPEINPVITILLSNPPYISPAQFANGTTARSVRRYEPKLALVPPARAPIHRQQQGHPHPRTQPPSADRAPLPTANNKTQNGNADNTTTTTTTTTTDAAGASSLPSPAASELRLEMSACDAAVVSARREDMFYPHVLSAALSWVDADLVVLECGDKGQAGRVAEMARRVLGGLGDGDNDNDNDGGGVEVEVWKCDDDRGGGCRLGMGDEDEDGSGSDADGGARAVVVRRGIFRDKQQDI